MHGDELAETAAEAAAVTGARPLGPGDAIGRYRVQRVLGQGGMGVVYAVHDPDLDRPVALKLLRGTPGDEARTRLLREARAMAKLSHPNVITVYEVGSAGAIDYVAMELIDGKSLAEWLAQSRRSTDEVLRVFRAAARGLQAAHQVGLVHRDFKPANVLVGSGERIVVTDFGLARAFDDLTLATAAQPATAATPVTAAALPGGRPDAASLSSTLTRTGALLGTPAYMAPEQFAGVTAGPRSDQYAFCVALWEALTGARPFRGATIDELRRQAQAGDAVGADALPRRLRPILARGMARDPADRYPDLGALVAAIDRSERRPRNLVMAATAGAAVVAAVATVALWPHGARAPSATRLPPCPDPAVELADAWSPTQGAALAAHLTAVPGAWRELSDGLDRVAAGWRDAQRATCATPLGPERDGRLSCLALVEDELAAAAAFATATAPAAVRPAAILDEVDDPTSCLLPAGSARPGLPADPATRAELSAIRRDLVRMLMTEGDAAVRDQADRAIARARSLAYPAALAEALLAAGAAAHRAEDYGRAEAMFDEAATVAETIAADGLRAAAMVGTAGCTAARSSDLGLIRGTMTKARAAVTRAGDPPGLVANLDLIAAMLALGGGDLDDAVTTVERARAGFDRAGAGRLAVVALALEAEVRNRRDHGDDVARATDLLSDAIDRAGRLFGDDAKVSRALRMSQGWILADHDPERAARVFATVSVDDPAPAGARPVRARVVGPDGRPRAGAAVHVGRRLIALADGTMLTVPLDRPPHSPRRTATDTAGRFTSSGLPDDVVEVVAGDLRSRPTRVRDLPATIVVRPTHAARVRSPIALSEPGSLTVMVTPADGAVDLGYQAVTRRLDAQTWEVGALPDGVPLRLVFLRIRRTSADYINRGFTATDADPIELAVPAPPPGVVLDLAVRGDRFVDIPGANVFVIVGRELAGTSLRLVDFGPRAFAAGRMFTAYARPGDPSTAPAPSSTGGAQPDDLRVVIPDVPAGPVTVCVLPFGKDIRDPRLLETVPDPDQLEVHCKGIDVPAGVASHAAVIETPAMQRPR